MTAELHEHIARLPGKVTWYADPSGATEIAECRAAGLTVLRGHNDIRLGITLMTVVVLAAQTVFGAFLFAFFLPEGFGQTTRLSGTRSEEGFRETP